MPKAPVCLPEVVNAFPHDPRAFTQGLVFDEGWLYESTGNYGRSSLRRVELESGAVLHRVTLPATQFGEGLALWRERLIQLTWRSGVALVWDKRSFAPLGSFPYRGEGWGLACDGQRLVMSDGSATLRFRDPQSFEVTGQLEVRDDGDPVRGLNELQIVHGELWANVWPDPAIARIDLASGRVVGWIGLFGLIGLIGGRELANPLEDVANGIAHDAERDRLFVTGKHWPKLFEIRLGPEAGTHRT